MDAGVYVVLAEIIDRLGGAPIRYDYQKSMRNLDKLKQKIIEYERIKLRFLKESKIDISTQESEGMLHAVYEDDHDEHKQQPPDGDGDGHSDGNEHKEPAIDMDKYECLRFVQRHTRYRNFHGGFNDEEFYVDENLFLLYPPMNRARPSNCIQFKLIKLSSETSLDDKVVGWGVFPILNSELTFNEGRFKIPLLQGDVNEEITLFRTIQSGIIDNLDTWLCNMYFEVEPLLIQNLVFDYKEK